MRKTRLNGTYRQRLKTLVQEIVQAPVEEAIMIAANIAVAPLILAVVNAKYPVADMAILKKYEAASPDRCINIQGPSQGVSEFKFLTVESAPLVARNCHWNQIYLIDQETLDLFLAWEEAETKWDDALKTKRSDYYSLINSSTTFEQVIEIWPEASRLLTKISPHTAVALLNEDIVNRIKKDVESREGNSAAS